MRNHFAARSRTRSIVCSRAYAVCILVDALITSYPVIRVYIHARVLLHLWHANSNIPRAKIFKFGGSQIEMLDSTRGNNSGRIVPLTHRFSTLYVSACGLFLLFFTLNLFCFLTYVYISFSRLFSLAVRWMLLSVSPTATWKLLYTFYPRCRSTQTSRVLFFIPLYVYLSLLLLLCLFYVYMHIPGRNFCSEDLPISILAVIPHSHATKFSKLSSFSAWRMQLWILSVQKQKFLLAYYFLFFNFFFLFFLFFFFFYLEYLFDGK